MAFTSFGTGMRALATGLSWRYNMDAELKRIEMLSQQTKEYWTEKEKQAKEWAEMTKKATVNNEADARAYDQDYQKRVDEIEAFKRKNPNYKYDPILYGQYNSMTDGLRNNDITKRAIEFDKQATALNEHLAKNPGFANTPEGQAIMEEFQYRQKNGMESYMKKYGKGGDFMFSIPEDLDAAAELFMKERESTISDIVESMPGIYQVRTRLSYNLNDNDIDQFILVHSDMIAKKLIPEFKKNYPDETPVIKNIVRDFLLSKGRKTINTLGPVVHNEGDDQLKRQQIAAMNARSQFANYDMDPYAYGMQLGGGSITDNIAFKCLPSKNVLNKNGQVTGTIFNGGSLYFTGPSQGRGYKMMLSQGFVPFLSDAGSARIDRGKINTEISTDVVFKQIIPKNQYKNLVDGNLINKYKKDFKDVHGATSVTFTPSTDGNTYTIAVTIPSKYSDYDGSIWNSYNMNFLQTKIDARNARGVLGEISLNLDGTGSPSSAGTVLSASEQEVLNSLSGE